MAKFSLALAIIMVALYVLGLVFSLVTHRDIFLDEGEDEGEEEAKWSLRKGVIVMIGPTMEYVYTPMELLGITISVILTGHS